MPFCPECRTEYRPGFTACADCGAALVDELPPAQHARSASATDVVVARVHGQPLAQMWAELLGNHGVASRMAPITGIADNAYPTDTLYEIRVAAIDAPRARDILPATPHDRPTPPNADAVLDEVDAAIAEGNLGLADELLASLEDGDERAQPST